MGDLDLVTVVSASAAAALVGRAIRGHWPWQSRRADADAKKQATVTRTWRRWDDYACARCRRPGLEGEMAWRHEGEGIVCEECHGGTDG